MKKDIYKRGLVVALGTCVFLGAVGGVLHSPIDILSGATPKSQRTNTTKLTGAYILVMNTSAAPFTDAAAREALQTALTRKDTDVSPLQGSPMRLAYPSTDDALQAYCEALEQRLHAQGIAVTMVPMEPVMLRSRMLVGKYTAILGPANDFTVAAVPDQQTAFYKSYEMR